MDNRRLSLFPPYTVLFSIFQRNRAVTLLIANWCTGRENTQTSCDVLSVMSHEPTPRGKFCTVSRQVFSFTIYKIFAKITNLMCKFCTDSKQFISFTNKKYFFKQQT